MNIESHVGATSGLGLPPIALMKENPLNTVKRLIIGDYLFGEIAEFVKFAKISCHQIVTLQSLDISSVGKSPN